MKDLKVIGLLISIPVILIYCMYTTGQEWYKCDKAGGQYVKTLFGHTCILPK